MGNFQLLEVVGGGSETQLQAGENVCSLTLSLPISHLCENYLPVTFTLIIHPYSSTERSRFLIVVY